MKEIAVLEFDGRLISSLREYWASEPVGQTAGVPAHHVSPERGMIARDR